MNDRPGGSLPAERGYKLWADRYDVENAVTTLDCLAVRQLTPPLDGIRFLDAACGTGRRLPHSAPDGPVCTVGADRVLAMLNAGRDNAGRAAMINADVAALPLGRRAFDGIWCRLALGHVPDLLAAYREFHRVLDRRGWLIVTDFHPEAARAGHLRTFRDASGRVRAVAFRAHTMDAHSDAARAAGLEVDVQADLEVGPEVRHFYERAGMLPRYEADVGLPLIMAWRFRT